ncbi:tetratricopeptide repeat protein [Leadbettera azotonutricia]|uniref:Tetratricopeptide repeat domain protein n=1 Tax=Leadbettera azotonutricia (strain ATCC BAA-888 / DSM 13862 / ZAS-9) TaxID=545695 RepID=F5Y8E7_LEAAZ|nr:tetratricopeptide repeat protein [Leadbettera azotonutricia]AEF80413.1 tetratricopeptide repeat domain protein [Leadbettera azotonutricia ZAS-9]
MKGNRTRLCAAILCVFLGACGSNPDTRETPLPAEIPVPVESPQPAPPRTGGIAEEIRSLVEKGTPPALFEALELIRNRDLGNSEFGRVMNYVDATLLKVLYSATGPQLPQIDPPQTHVYTRILRDAEKGAYLNPMANSQDYLEFVLPFLALYAETRSERLLPALPDLQKAAELNSAALLAPFFMGIVYERSQRLDEANAQYSKAWQLSSDCYPAALGLARVLDAKGQRQEAAQLLQDLVIRFPDNLQIKRQLAIAWYRAGIWSRAEPAIAEILQRDNRDGEFILMRAHVLVEEGQFLQAQAPLDLYASINPNNRLYLFLRARVQSEGYRNRDAALNYLRSLLRGSAGAIDDEASVYAARLLMESSRQEDQNEGRDLLRRLLANPSPSLTVVTIALQDAVRRQAWAEARPYLARLLDERRSPQDLLSAYTVEHGQGNNAAALSYARELYEADRANEEGIIAYISALIDTGRQDEAARMIDTRLTGMSGGVLKARYHYLRSRTRASEDAIMNDLRSSLFEDPRNLLALTAMFEIYHRRRDERRAVYYLKQALALAPDNPQLKRYEGEYAGLL